MFGFLVKIEDRTEAVQKAADQAAFRNFGHAAASIARDARTSIETHPDPSPPGTPPHTRRRQLARAIRWSADKLSAIIGPLYSMVGTSGAAHEFGGKYKDETYPERSFMHPAAQRGAPRFAGDWQGSVGE